MALVAIWPIDMWTPHTGSRRGHSKTLHLETQAKLATCWTGLCCNTEQKLWTLAFVLAKDWTFPLARWMEMGHGDVRRGTPLILPHQKGLPQAPHPILLCGSQKLSSSQHYKNSASTDNTKINLFFSKFPDSYCYMASCDHKNHKAWSNHNTSY